LELRGIYGGVNLVIAVDDPTANDVHHLVECHLAFARAASPPCHTHALGVDGLGDRSVTLFSARRDGALVGVGALKHLDESHGELKSMHTVESERGRGVGRALLDHLLRVAASRGYRRVSLETGTMDEFAPARAMYAGAGFADCEPFEPYSTNPYSICMTIEINPADAR
jgi:putative acetyltransferase